MTSGSLGHPRFLKVSQGRPCVVLAAALFAAVAGIFGGNVFMAAECVASGPSATDPSSWATEEGYTPLQFGGLFAQTYLVPLGACLLVVFAVQSCLSVCLSICLSVC